MNRTEQIKGYLQVRVTVSLQDNKADYNMMHI